MHDLDKPCLTRQGAVGRRFCFEFFLGILDVLAYLLHLVAFTGQTTHQRRLTTSIMLHWLLFQSRPPSSAPPTTKKRVSLGIMSFSSWPVTHPPPPATT